MDTGLTLNIKRTFNRLPGLLLNVLHTFSLCPVSRGIACQIATFVTEFQMNHELKNLYHSSDTVGKTYT